jgi:monovalent cation:H+ antiporter-2, CPA2 family
MVHLPSLIQDLGVILITAAVTTLLFKRLKQPVVLGYLIAGFLVGPHVHFFPNILDKKSVHVWAEIGVIFLLFGLGLEFSFKKLAKVGKSAAIAALFEVLTMTGAGYVLGQALGWTKMDSLFLGTILSMSSTTIIIRAFQELGLKAKGFVALVFGVLIVEDLAAILIMVILSIIASPEATSGTHVLYSIARLGFFLLLWFVVGIYFVPSVLKRIKGLLSDETMLIMSIGLCLLMVIVASKAGFSPALGAFVMGSILAETPQGKRIEHLIIPVRDLFGAVFFVSVGMMVDPVILKDNFGVIGLILIVTVVGKLVGSGMGALLSGRSLRQSMQAGLSLAQIGEFSFLIAALGVSLKATSDFLYPIVIAVSAVTTFTTPYLIKFSGPIADWLERHIPENIRHRLQRYEAGMVNGSRGNGFTLLLKEHGPKVILNSVVVIALSLLFSRVILPKTHEVFGESLWIEGVICVLALAFCVPFIRAIVIGSKPGGDEKPEELKQLIRLDFGALSIRILVALILLGAIIGQFASIRTASGIMLVILGAVAVLFSRHSEPLYQSIEKRFLDNLNEKEREEVARDARPALAPWDATLAEFVVSPHSPLVAQSLEDSAFKENTGTIIAMIDRGGKKILAPGRAATLLPFDRVSVIGNDEQLVMARSKLEVDSPPFDSAGDRPFGLASLFLPEGSRFSGKSIRECGLREELDGLIVGVERGNERTLNPDSSVILQGGDRLWIVGDTEKIDSLREKLRIEKI